jgi:hypothetical protein
MPKAPLDVVDAVPAESDPPLPPPPPPVPDAPPTPEYPAKIKLMSHHGFIDDNGVHRFWPAGSVIVMPADVALLVDRGADHIVLE